ncbi:sporulation protein YqfD [Lentibacillus juripiscarius]|uniref:Sporulation protein YqfD n=1 Tax=Lentibacillus juripiscarius TaxID=257446 RepID=A0ABW5V1Z6_9BACI
MKLIQGSFITGYVTVRVEGWYPELFFQRCASQGIMVWNIQKKSENVCSGNIKLQDISGLRKQKWGTNYKLTFTSKRGFPFLMKKFIRRKEVLLALTLSVLLIFSLSNIIWEVKITNVPKDLEEKISKQLDEYGIHRGSWTFTLDPPSEIQQQLMNDIPELLWIGVHQKGTTFVLEGVEKTIVEEEEVDGPRNLVASKKGVIEKMYVAKGQPMVRVNDYVEKGDVLVSGKMPTADDENADASDDEEDEESPELTAAEGEVIAKTWYETEVTVPLTASTDLLTGEKKKKYHLKLNSFELPIWGFGDPDYKQAHRERNEKDLYFFKWKLPIKFVETTVSEKKHQQGKRSKEEAIEAGIRQAKKELQLKLGPDAKIKSENILHQSTENGKVKLILYMVAEEDIVRQEPIDQGD